MINIDTGRIYPLIYYQTRCLLGLDNIIKERRKWGGDFSATISGYFHIQKVILRSGISPEEKYRDRQDCGKMDIMKVKRNEKEEVYL